MQRRSCVNHVMIFSAFIKILQLKSDDWVVIILLCLGQHLIQHCVIIQRDEKGYGLTVTGDNPVYVQSVKEGLHDVYSFFCEERVFFRIHTHARVVTKISSCRVNTISRRGTQTARDFFWFYFSSIFQ